MTQNERFVIYVSGRHRRPYHRGWASWDKGGGLN